MVTYTEFNVSCFDLYLQNDKLYFMTLCLLMSILHFYVDFGCALMSDLGKKVNSLMYNFEFHFW